MRAQAIEVSVVDAVTTLVPTTRPAAKGGLASPGMSSAAVLALQVLLVGLATLTCSSSALASGLPGSLCNQTVSVGSNGDFLHRPDSAKGIVRWHMGVGNTWTVECVQTVTSRTGGKLATRFRLRSWRGDYLVVEGGKWRGEFNQDRGQKITSGPATGASTWSALKHASPADTYSIRSVEKAWFLKRGSQRTVVAGRDTQGWRIAKSTTPDLASLSGQIVTLRNQHGGRALSTLHNANDRAHQGNQEPVIQYSAYGDSTQRWRLKPVGGGKFAILNQHDGRALTTLHNSKDSAYRGNQEPVIIYDYYGDATQHWRLEKANGGYKVINAHDGRALSTLHNSKDHANRGNQEPIILYDFYGDATQIWDVR